MTWNYEEKSETIIRKPEYQGEKEISARMNWSIRFLKRMIKEEGFPVGRIGGRRLITTESKIQRWVNQKVDNRVTPD